jgi:hypothetical protein
VAGRPATIHETIAAAKRYESMELGLSDASLVVLAARLHTTDIATLDERHFRAVKPCPAAMRSLCCRPTALPPPPRDKPEQAEHHEPKQT